MDNEWRQLTVPLLSVANAMEYGGAYYWTTERHEAMKLAVRAVGELQRRYEAMEASRRELHRAALALHTAEMDYIMRVELQPCSEGFLAATGPARSRLFDVLHEGTKSDA